MRYDIFLSSLLFGITLLTCSLAIIHLAAGFLLKSTNFPPHARRLIRMFLLGASISFSLLLFLVRLSIDLSGKNPFNFNEDSIVSNLLPRRVITVEASAPPTRKSDPFLESAKTWTLYDKPTAELKSQLRQAELVADASSGVVAWTSKPNPECRGWLDRARALRLEPKTIPPGSSLASGTLLIICPETELGRAHWERIRSHAFNGGSVLLVGRPSGMGTDEAQALLRVRSWNVPDQTRPAKIVIGGARMAWGGMPSGLTVHFGNDRGSSLLLADVPLGTGEALLDRDQDDVDFARNASRNLTALLLREFGSGRVAWTSLPARLSAKLEPVHGTAWETLGQRVFAHLLQAPQIGLELWPSGTRAPVGVSVYADANPSAALKISRLLENRKVPASQYLLMNWASSNASATGTLISTPHETGAADLDQQGDPLKLDFYSRYKRLARWVEQFNEFPRPLNTNVQERTPAQARLAPGALTVPGISAVPDQYAALIANGFAYAVLDPFGDQLSPMRAHLTKTEALMLHLADGLPPTSAPSSGSLVIWPHRALDDLALIQRAPSSQLETELLKTILSQFRYSSWAGGPYLFRISLNGLGKNEALLGRILEELRREGAGFIDLGTLAGFWDLRSEIDITIDPIAPARIPRDLRALWATKHKSRPQRQSERAVDPDAAIEELYEPNEESAEDFLGQASARARKDSPAYRVWIRNTGSRVLEKAVLRISEGQHYRIYGDNLKIETVTIPTLPGSSDPAANAQRVRTTQIQLDDLAPGEVLSFWMELDEIN